ncbi:unannotated protein [freshwater metagenome]|uniref:Unannotated protein n=1 Tax=freshwater metagenome TaxID=449393 RepID=A0A6J7R7Q3_9ZZZZ
MGAKYAGKVASHGSQRLVAEGSVEAREQRLEQPGSLVKAAGVRHRILMARLDVVGQHVGESFTQNPLFEAVAHLELQGDSHGEQQHLKVEIWNSCLNTESHAAAVDALQFSSRQMSDLVQEQSSPVVGRHARVHVVAAKQLIRTIAGEDDLDSSITHTLENLQRHHRIDDVAVLGDLGDSDRLADVSQADISWREGHHLMRHAQFAREPTRKLQVRASRSANSERHAVGMHLLDVDQRERGVEPTGENDSHRQVGVDTQSHTLAVGRPQCGPRLLNVIDHRLALAKPEQIDVGHQRRITSHLNPSAVPGRNLVHGQSGRH